MLCFSSVKNTRTADQNVTSLTSTQHSTQHRAISSARSCSWHYQFAGRTKPWASYFWVPFTYISFRCIIILAREPSPYTLLNAAGQLYKQTIEFVYLGGAISAHRDLSIEITRRLQRARACCQRYKMEIYDHPGVRLRLKVLLLKAEVIKTLLRRGARTSLTMTGYDGFTTLLEVLLVSNPSSRYFKTLEVIWYTLQVASTTNGFQSGGCHLSMQYVASTRLSSHILDT